LGAAGVVPIAGAMMNRGGNIDRRIERVMFETDRYEIVGDVTLPPEGYQSRFSDTMNREDFAFIPLVNVEITDRETGQVSERPFIVVGKAHVRIAHPI
jgi:hypothetical protein